MIKLACRFSTKLRNFKNNLSVKRLAKIKSHTQQKICTNSISLEGDYFSLMSVYIHNKAEIKAKTGTETHVVR